MRKAGTTETAMNIFRRRLFIHFRDLLKGDALHVARRLFGRLCAAEDRLIARTPRVADRPELRAHRHRPAELYLPLGINEDLVVSDKRVGVGGFPGGRGLTGFAWCR